MSFVWGCGRTHKPQCPRIQEQVSNRTWPTFNPTGCKGDTMYFFSVEGRFKQIRFAWEVGMLRRLLAVFFTK